MTVITKEYLKQELDQFNEQQLKQVADFIAFIKFQTRFSQTPADIS
jgi:RecJ-like exonuclease